MVRRRPGTAPARNVSSGGEFWRSPLRHVADLGEGRGAAASRSTGVRVTAWSEWRNGQDTGRTSRHDARHTLQLPHGTSTLSVRRPRGSMAVAERQLLTRERAARTVSWAHGTLALSFGEMAAAVDADQRTVRRWRGGQGSRPAGASSGQPRGARRPAAPRRGGLGAHAQLAQWLEAPLKAFRDQSPAAMLRRGCVKDVVGSSP